MEITTRKNFETMIDVVNNHEDRIKEALEASINGKTITKEDEYVLKLSMIAFGLDKLIPHEYYDNITIRFEGEDSKRIGVHKKKGKQHTIIYNMKQFYPVIDLFTLIKYLSCFCHEIHHARQQINAENGDENLATLMYSLECFISDYYRDKFYNKFYKSLFTEIEADLMGNMMVCNFLRKYRSDVPFHAREYLNVVMDHYKPDWGEYSDTEYIKHHTKKMIEFIMKNPYLCQKLYHNPYRTLFRVFNIQGEMHPTSYFEDKLTSCNEKNDNNYLYGRKMFYEILKEISTEMYDQKRLYK